MEIKKILKRPIMFVITILAVIGVLLMLLFYTYKGKNSYQDSISQLLHQYSGELSEAEQKNILEKKEELEEYIFQFNENHVLPQEYSEDSLKVEVNQYNALTKQIQYYKELQADRKKVVENVARVRKLEEKAGVLGHYNKTLYDQIEADYSKEIRCEVYDNQGVTTLFDVLELHTWDFLLVLLFVILYCGMFSYEHEKSVFNSIYSCRDGRGSLYIKKLRAAMTITFVYSIILMTASILIVYVQYKITGVSEPLQTIQEFKYYPYNWTILQGLLFVCSMKVIALEVMTIFICTVSTFFKKSVITALVCGILLFGGMGFYYYCNYIISYGANVTEFASNVIEKMKTAVCIPFLESDTYFEMYDEINVLGDPLNRMWLNLIVTLLVGAVLFGLGLWSYSKKQRE
ncbi:MAG: hypothetical protein Q4G58_15125 [bacterium]|nr:hypothetical protein [bacterium]